MKQKCRVFEFFVAAGGAIKSISEMGQMLTMLTTGGLKSGPLSGPHESGSSPSVAPSSGGQVAIPSTNSLSGGNISGNASSSAEDTLVMDTKVKIIEILRFILDVRLDYRISCLLSIFKREFDESEKNER